MDIDSRPPDREALSNRAQHNQGEMRDMPFLGNLIQNHSVWVSSIDQTGSAAPSFAAVLQGISREPSCPVS